MGGMTYSEFIKNSKMKINVKKTSIFDNELVVGTLILVFCTILFMLFREFLDNYGDKLLKDRQIRKGIREWYQRKKEAQKYLKMYLILLIHHIEYLNQFQ